MDTWSHGTPDHGHESWEEYIEHSLTRDDVNIHEQRMDE